MNNEELQRLVESALDSFRRFDLYLLQNNLSERCIAARLAFHMQNALTDPRLSADVEYDRKGIDRKRLNLPEECLRDRERDNPLLVLPDIIVHSRGPEGPNLLVLEMKKTSNRQGFDCDRRRLQAFKQQLNYNLGGLIELETRADHDAAITLIEWH